MGVDRCRLELLVAQQDLDHADVDLALQQVGGKGVAQRVRGHALGDAGSRGGVVHGAIEPPSAQWLHHIQPREEPAAGQDLALGMADTPPGTQPLQHHRAEHGVAVLGTLALFDTQRHAVDQVKLEVAQVLDRGRVRRALDWTG